MSCLTNKYALDDLKVQVHGTVGIVTGRNTVKAMFQGT